MSASADQVVLSVNPKAGPKHSGRRVERLLELLRQEGFQVEVCGELDQAAARANEAHAAGRLRALVGVGGDGTAAELANRTPPGLPWTMFPAGNENLLARHFKMGFLPETCVETVARGKLLTADAGLANGRVFLLMASCGFDAEVVRRLHLKRTGHAGNASYIRPILASMCKYRFPELRVELAGDADDEPGEGTGYPLGALGPDSPGSPAPVFARWLFAFNLPTYGGGLRIAPEADGHDGLLDLCLFRRGGIWSGLRYATAVMRGCHQDLADCLVRRVRRLKITAAREVPYQLDGDPGGWLPLEIEVLPGRLSLLVPAEAESQA